MKDLNDTPPNAIKQVIAINYAKEARAYIIHRHSDITVLYQNGQIQSGIAAYLQEIDPNLRGYSAKVVLQAVGEALRELLPEEEMKHIAINNIQIATRELVASKRGIHGEPREDKAVRGRALHEARKGIHARTPAQKAADGYKGGISARDKGVGIHGRSKEEVIATARLGGLASAANRRIRAALNPTPIKVPMTNREIGLMTKEKGLGIHAQTSEERRLAGNKAALATGKIPWDAESFQTPAGEMTPGQYCIHLSKEVEFQTKFGKADNAKIAQEINHTCYKGEPVRTTRSVVNHLYRSRKRSQ